MEFKNLVEAAEKWCTGNPFDLIFAEEDDERRLDFYAEPGVSFYVLCPGDTDSFVSAAGPQSFVCVCVSVRECVRACVGGGLGLGRGFSLLLPSDELVVEDESRRGADVDVMMSFHCPPSPPSSPPPPAPPSTYVYV